MCVTRLTVVGIGLKTRIANHARLGRSFYTCGSHYGLHYLGHVHNTLDMGWVDAVVLAPAHRIGFLGRRKVPMHGFGFLWVELAG